jgi:AcrR family transcriptional regulator
VSAGARAAKIGRPRALSLDTILDAALGLGLNTIRMPALAAELGIGTATLYNYVSGRDELLRLAAGHSVRPLQLVATKDWRDLVRQHAQNTFATWSAEPQLIDQFMRGAIGPDILIDTLETFLAALRNYGFSGEASYRIMSVVHTVAFGAVVRSYYRSSVASPHSGHKSTIRRALAERDADDLPNLRASIYLIEDPDFDFDAALDAVIEGFAGYLGQGEGATAGAASI